MGDKSPRANLLVVDSEPNIREVLAESLRFRGFHVLTAVDVAEAFEVALEYNPDLVILGEKLLVTDEIVAQRDSLEFGRDGMLIFCRAHNSVDDRVIRLMACDDYIGKPFGLDEIAERIQSTLRRAGMRDVPILPRMSCQDLEFDDELQELNRMGRRIELSPTALSMLRYLLLNQGMVVSGEQIARQVWGDEFESQIGIVESYIAYLHRKIDNGGQRLIHVVSGGYLLGDTIEGLELT